MNTTKLLQSVKNLQTKEEIVRWLYKNLTPTDAYETIAELVLNYPQEQEIDNRVTVNEVVFNQIITAVSNSFKVVELETRGRISDYAKLGYIGAMKKILQNRAGCTNSLINLKLRQLYKREKLSRDTEGVDTTNFIPTQVDRNGNVVNLPEELAKLAEEEMSQLPFEIQK